jgi:hypothetical protein
VDVGGGDVSTASPRVLPEESTKVRIESQHGHRGVEAPGDGDEAEARLWGYVRGLGHCRLSAGEPGDDPPVTFHEDPSVRRIRIRFGR